MDLDLLKAFFSTLLLLLACVLIPMLLAIVASPWAGAAGAALAWWLWVRQVPSGPGLLQGVVATTGCFMILGLILAFVIVGVRLLAR